MRSRVQAFSLVEVTLALGIAGFCLVAIFGLLPVGITSTQTALEQTAANALLSSVVSDLQSTPPSIPRGQAVTSKFYAVAIPASGSAATATFYLDGDGKVRAQAADARYRVTLSFPATSGGKRATIAHLKMSWPAPASLQAAVGSIETVVAFDRN